MNNPQLAFTNVLEILTSAQLLLSIIGFVIFSYLLVALFTWSLTKPLKYLSIPFIIIGIIILIIRFTFPVLIAAMPQNELNIPNTIISSLLSPFLKSGIICLIIGILSMTAYIVICKLSKKKVTTEEKIKTEKQEKKN